MSGLKNFKHYVLYLYSWKAHVGHPAFDRMYSFWRGNSDALKRQGAANFHGSGMSFTGEKSPIPKKIYHTSSTSKRPQTKTIYSSPPPEKTQVQHFEII